MTTAVVAPFAGAWIEICNHPPECGTVRVAPFAGAWIEMCDSLTASSASDVAPFAGAWIEMGRMYTRHRCSVWSLPSRERGLKWKQCSSFRAVRMSLPSRERGLKSALHRGNSEKAAVAPFAGAWIEMCPRTSSRSYPSARRSLRGSVD